MILQPNDVGWVEVICGSMFSGKTEELIRRLKRAKYARQRVQIFKPRIDDRYHAESIVTHDRVALSGIAVESVSELKERLDPQVEVVGFHGQTLAHEPRGRGTHQLGDGDALAEALECDTVWDFRSADVALGGEGAPLAPFFHFACAQWTGATAPVAFLNLGGVGNLTWVDPTRGTPEAPGALLAFDTGPANAPLNDLVAERRGWDCDRDGALAAQGEVVDGALADVAGGQLGAQIAQGHLGHAHIDAQDFEDGFFGHAAAVEFEPGQAQALLENLGIVAGRAARQTATQVEVVGGADGKGDAFSFPEDGFDDEDVGDVHAAVKGIIHGKYVPRLHPVTEFVEERRHREWNRRNVVRQRDALRDHFAVFIAERG